MLISARHILSHPHTAKRLDGSHIDLIFWGALKSQSLFDASELAGGIIWMHLNRCSQTRDARGINPLYAGMETISVLFLAQKENEVTSATGISIKKEGASLDTLGELS